MKVKWFGSKNMVVFQFADGMEILFSYRTPVAAFIPGMGRVVTETEYSVTTSKHIRIWLDGCQANEERSQEWFDRLLSDIGGEAHAAALRLVAEDKKKGKKS
jgi:hypothetical protein